MIGQFKDLTTLWHTASRRLLFGDREHLDRWTGLTVVVYDNFLAAKSMAFDFDVGRDLWLTKARFPKLQRDYLDWAELPPFLDRCEKIATDSARRGVITQMACRPPKTKNGFRPMHVWGGCMLAFTYHGGPKWNQPTLGLHSRVSYIAYIGALDLALAYVLGKEIAQRAGIEVEDLAFRWHVDSLQWHGLKSVPYVIAHDLEDRVMDEERYPSRQYPAVGVTRRSIRQLHGHYEAGTGVDKQNNPFGPARRMRTRYNRYHDRDFLPSVPLDSLALLPEDRRT